MLGGGAGEVVGGESLFAGAVVGGESLFAGAGFASVVVHLKQQPIVQFATNCPIKREIISFGFKKFSRFYYNYKFQ